VHEGALRQAYLETMLEDPGLGLEGFLRRAVGGEFGPVGREELLEFLHQVQQDTIAGIYTRASAHAEAAEEIERLVEERRERIAALAARYAPQP